LTFHLIFINERIYEKTVITRCPVVKAGTNERLVSTINPSLLLKSIL